MRPQFIGPSLSAVRRETPWRVAQRLSSGGERAAKLYPVAVNREGASVVTDHYRIGTVELTDTGWVGH